MNFSLCRQSLIMMISQLNDPGHGTTYDPGTTDLTKEALVLTGNVQQPLGVPLVRSTKCKGKHLHFPLGIPPIEDLCIDWVISTVVTEKGSCWQLGYADFNYSFSN